MQLKVALSIDALAQLIRAHGTLREKASVTGRDCYQFETAAGKYSVPTYEGFWAPCDFAYFEPAPNSEGTDILDADHHVLEQALGDPAIVALLSEATIEWTAKH